MNYESPDLLEELTERALRDWLGREDLNTYDPAKNRVAISEIFKWYSDDFTGDGEIPRVLARFGPKRYRDFFERGEFRVTYMDYHWGLNDQSELGAEYRHGILRRLRGLF